MSVDWVNPPSASIDWNKPLEVVYGSGAVCKARLVRKSEAGDTAAFIEVDNGLGYAGRYVVREGSEWKLWTPGGCDDAWLRNVAAPMQRSEAAEALAAPYANIGAALDLSTKDDETVVQIRVRAAGKNLAEEIAHSLAAVGVTREDLESAASLLAPTPPKPRRVKAYLCDYKEGQYVRTSPPTLGEALGTAWVTEGEFVED